jgi:hypothetical protein
MTKVVCTEMTMIFNLLEIAQETRVDASGIEEEHRKGAVRVPRKFWSNNDSKEHKR